MMYRFLIIIVFILCCGAANAIATSRGKVVEYLPGFEGPLPFHLETGYVGVDENEDVQLFYYFLKSESDPKVDPLLLWISGGPGSSSFSGLVYEIGPIVFEDMHYDGSFPTFTLRPASWTKISSIIFLDIPVGTGFSYARTTCASYSSNNQLSDHAYEFMRKWLESHKEFMSNPFYIGGDSYSGIAVPMVTQLISNGNEAGIVPYINLKGYVVGNPYTFPAQSNYIIRFANGMGLISDEIYKSLLDSCHGEYRPDYINTTNVACLQNLETFNQCIDGIDEGQVLEPYCGYRDSFIQLPSQRQFRDKSHPSAFYCRNEAHKVVSYWANDVGVRQALHIREGTLGKWVRVNWDINFTYTVDDARPYHLNLSQKGYRSLVYSGDHDMVIPHQSTEAWIKDLNYSVIDQWRSWKLHGQVAGYTQSYSNMMTYATIKGGGHTAPEYRPDECFAMFKRWISYQPL